MMNPRTANFHMLLDASLVEALGATLKILVVLYTVLAALLSLVFAVIIVGVVVSYTILRLLVRFVYAQVFFVSYVRQHGFSGGLLYGKL